MRSLKFHVIAGIFLLLSIYIQGCKSTSSQSDSATGKTDVFEKDGEVAEYKKDTVVYSYPIGYVESLDTLEASNMVEIRSYKDILELFEKLNYTPEAWQAGIREVPRVYLTIVGDRWGSSTTKEISIENKKRIFFRGLAPLILHGNELITTDRDRLEQIRAAFMNGDSLPAFDRIWIWKLADLYKTDHNEKVTMEVLDQLLEKVDIVPPSLALAQGAEESGWGTSRFAAEGNAIYGQWTWGKEAIVPEAQRKELGNYGIRAFEALQESVSAYMLNLNTHRAYADLRARRAELRKNGQKVTGSVLAEELINYSERGEDYVKTLKQLMDYNRLEPTDDAFLADTPPIYMIPVDLPGE
jgi:Bax protein